MPIGQPLPTELDPASDHRKIVKIFLQLLLAYAILILYVTIVPFHFDFSPENILRGWRNAERIPFFRGNLKHASGSDMFSNILLFIPFGFFLHGWRLSRRGHQRGSYVTTAFLGFLFSLSIESAQLLEPNRYTSINDVMTNTVGAYLGAWLARSPYFAGAQILRGLGFFKKYPLMWLWTSLLGAQTILALLPFLFNFKTRFVVERLHRWVASWHSLPLITNKPVTPALLETFLLALLLAAIWVYARKSYKPHSRKSLLGYLFLLLFYPVLSAGQWFVVARRPDGAFLVAGLSGVISGLLIFHLLGRQSLSRNGKQSSRLTSLQHVITAVYILLFAAVFFYPLQSQMLDWRAALAKINWFPFAGDFGRGPAEIFAKYLQTMALAMPLGFFVGQRMQKILWSFRVTSVIASSLLVGAGIEMLQALFVAQRADITQVLFWTCGAVAGVALAGWWQQQRRQDAGLVAVEIATTTSRVAIELEQTSSPSSTHLI